MSTMNTLGPDDRGRALLAMKTAVQRRADILSVPGETGNDVVSIPAPPVSSRAPKGWEPRITFGVDGRPSEVFSPAIPEGMDETEALKNTLTLLNAMVPDGYWARLDEMRLDEAGWHRRQNEDGVGEGDAFTAPVRRYKWKIELQPTLDASIASMSEADWQAACDAVARRKFPAIREITASEAQYLVMPIGDLQVGQHDGDGLDGLIARMALYPLYAKAEIARLKRIKVPVKGIILPTLGDLVENILGFYANQQWLVTQNRRDQAKAARRLILQIIQELATLGYPILVPVVPGNHGQNRNKAGKLLTDLADNEDIALMEVVAENCAMHPTLREQVTFRFTEGHEQSVTLDLGWGYTVAFAHGHTGDKGGSGAASKQQNYLARQALAERAVGRASYYVTGHYHSAMYVTMPGGKTWVQIPAMCDRSEHFEEFFGLNGGPGMLSWTFGPQGLDNWRHHKLPTLLDLMDIPVPQH